MPSYLQTVCEIQFCLFISIIYKQCRWPLHMNTSDEYLLFTYVVILSSASDSMASSGLIPQISVAEDQHMHQIHDTKSQGPTGLHRAIILQQIRSYQGTKIT